MQRGTQCRRVAQQRFDMALPDRRDEEESAGPAASPRALLLDRLLDGATMKDAVREVSALPGQSRNAVYRASLEVADFLRRAGDEA